MGLQSVSNFLVPATGSTNAFNIRREFTSVPFYQEFSSQGLDGIPFRPSGVIIDNLGNSDPLIVLVNEMSFAVVCPAGQMIQMPFPAPLNCTFNITGGGVGTVVFVDYPVIPFTGSGGGGSVPVPLPVTGPVTAAQMLDALNSAVVAVQLPIANTQAALSSATGPGSISSANMISIKNTGAAAGTVAGGTLPPGESITWNAPNGGMLMLVNYDATGTTFLIATATVL